LCTQFTKGNIYSFVKEVHKDMFSTILLDWLIGWLYNIWMMGLGLIGGWEGRKECGRDMGLKMKRLNLNWFWFGYGCVCCRYWNPVFGIFGNFIQNPCPGHFSALKQIPRDNSRYLVKLPKNEYSCNLVIRHPDFNKVKAQKT